MNSTAHNRRPAPTRASVAALLAVTLVACGASEEPAPLSLTIPLPQELVCANLGALATMSAFVRVGGHTPCPLSVDTTTRQASGTCDRITIGIVRPLMVVYELPQPVGSQLQRAQLAYHVGFVNLEKAALDAGQEEVLVSLGTDDSTGSLVIREGGLQTKVAEVPAGDLKSALEWAVGEADDNSETLDHDEDDCANLAELCQLGYNGFFAERPLPGGPNNFDCN